METSMSAMEGTKTPEDPHDLARFVQAQAAIYPQALAELKSGRKCSHWMWFVFPQLQGLGFSSTSRRYAIDSLAQAQAYLEHPVLGHRLQACCEAVLAVRGRSAHDIFGSPDDMKLKSCATLFERVAPAGSVFARLLDACFRGQRDEATLRLLGAPCEGQ
jgi:uncharacterized protein (DUF1810 family)